MGKQDQQDTIYDSSSPPNRRGNASKIRKWLIVLTIIFLIGVFLSTDFTYSHCFNYYNKWRVVNFSFSSFSSLVSLEGRRKSPDARRISDIRQIGIVLELYKLQSGVFPVVTDDPAKKRWEKLMAILTSTIIDGQNFLPREINDICNQKNRWTESEFQYDYVSSSDGEKHVLKAVLSETNHPALLNDVDGEIMGIWCGERGNEREYCVVSSDAS